MIKTLSFAAKMTLLKSAATDTGRVAGLTHQYYKYPGRFSPTFAREAIRLFSTRGDVVLDPYMGGGTTIVEAYAAGRSCIGSDINPLAVFVTDAKTTILTDGESKNIKKWATLTVPSLSYRTSNRRAAPEDARTTNLSSHRAKPIKKFLTIALDSLDELETQNARQFARCILLNVGQWALNGRKHAVTLSQFRSRVTMIAHEMLARDREFSASVASASLASPILFEGSATELPNIAFLQKRPADLVVTSPPYPGVHMLYHRWQVDGRKETPAPYWIADCMDGHGSSHYTFGDRRRTAASRYFSESLATLRAVRAVMRDGAIMVQMIAFSEPLIQLPRYLNNMSLAGFKELRATDHSRIWRNVPGRNWYADQKGRTPSSREVVLVHSAA